MDTKHFKSLSKKWAFKLKEEAEDIEQEITLFFLTRQAEGKSLDVFQKGNEGALFELLKHKIRGNNLESMGGSGKRRGGAGDEGDESDLPEIKDEIESPDDKADQLKSRFEFEKQFCKELDQLDELSEMAGSHLGETFGFTGANGRMILAKLKKDIVVSAERRISAKQQSPKPRSQVKALQQMATA